MKLRRLVRGIITIVLALLLSVLLIRLSPGWNVEESDLDSRFSASTMKEVREARAARRGLLRFYENFGQSELFNRPVSDLIKERAVATVQSVSMGLLAAWFLALALAIVTSREGSRWSTAGASSVSGALLSCPSALLAIICLLLDFP